MMWMLWSALSFVLVFCYLSLRLYGHYWSGLFSQSYPHLDPSARSRNLFIPFFPMKALLLHSDLGIAGIDGLRFSIKETNLWDHLGKWLRLSRQYPAPEGNNSKDYILLCDAPALRAALQDSPEVRDCFTRLRRSCNPYGVYLHSLHVSPHRLWVRLKPFNSDTRIDSAAAAELIPRLQALHNALQQATNQVPAQAKRDRMVLRTSLLKAVSYSFCLLAFPSLLYVGHQDFITLDTRLTNGSIIPLVNLLTLLLVLLVVILLHGSSRRHRVLPVTILLGWPAMAYFLGSIGQLYNHNPSATSETVAITISDIRTVHDESGQTTYSLILDNRFNPARPLRLDVPKHFYEQQVANTAVRAISLPLYPGRLGVSWMPRNPAPGFTLQLD